MILGERLRHVESTLNNCLYVGQMASAKRGCNSCDVDLSNSESYFGSDNQMTANLNTALLIRHCLKSFKFVLKGCF